MEAIEKLNAHAFKLISIRPRSIAELRTLLAKFSRKHDTPDVLISHVIDDLVRRKYLDDAAFVRWWIAQRDDFRPLGKQAIRWELRAKGVDKTIVDQVISSLSGQRAGEYDQALALAQKRYMRLKGDTPEKQKIKLSRFLESRGFDWQTIHSVIDSVFQKE